jgi:hypothetical protein
MGVTFAGPDGKESDKKFKENMEIVEIMKLDEKEILAGILYHLRMQGKQLEEIKEEVWTTAHYTEREFKGGYL